MEFDAVVEFIQQNGYIALFLSFYVCLLGLPVPNEVLVMTGGFLATTDYFQPVITFLIIYLTVILNATILYLIGLKTGERFIPRIKLNRKLDTQLARATTLIHRHGSFAASICYLLPIVRHVIPFLMGSFRYSYSTFARYSYTAGFFWTLTLFLIGNYFSGKIDVIGKNLDWFVMMLLAALFCSLALKITLKQLKSKSRDMRV
jgi:membrane-associated protein